MTTDKSSEREAFERLQRAVDSYPGTGPAALLKAAMQVLAARAALPQQALDAPSDDLRELGKWLNEEPNRPIDRSALARVLAWAQVSAPQQAQEALGAESVARWLADHDLLEEAERVRAAIAKGEQSHG